MAKNKILTILAAVAVLLVVILTAGLIVSVAKDKTDKPVIDNNPTEEVKVSGKVYGDDGNELEQAKPTKCLRLWCFLCSMTNRLQVS